MLALTSIAPKRSEVFLIHKSNKPLTWNINERSAVVSFSNIDHALFIASLSESHYASNKEWPSNIKFSFHKQVIPTILGVKNEEYNKMLSMCTVWGVDLLYITDIQEKSPLQFGFSGEVHKTEFQYEVQKDFLEYLYITDDV